MTDDFEQRLRRIEDERAVERLIASYGRLVDAGDADVAAMARSDAHQGLIGRGSSHFLGPAVVTIDGDDAVAICESVLLVRRDQGDVAARAGANYFRLHRIDDRWQIVARTTRTLDGGTEARDLLADGVAGRAR